MNRIILSYLFSLLFAIIPCVHPMDDPQSATGTGLPPASCHAAGVLPCTLNEEGKVLFLLGKEDVSYKKPKTNDWIVYECWCDFGGSKNAGEVPKNTAAREFSEETRCFFGLLNQSLSRLNLKCSQDYIGGHLDDKYMVFNKGYAMYLAFVDYVDPQLIKGCPEAAHSEKKEYMWVDAQEFLACVKNSKNSTGDNKAIDFGAHGKIRHGMSLLVKSQYDQLQTILQELSGYAKPQHMIREIVSPVPTQMGDEILFQLPYFKYGIIGLGLTALCYAGYRWYQECQKAEDKHDDQENPEEREAQTA